MMRWLCVIFSDTRISFWIELSVYVSVCIFRPITILGIIRVPEWNCTGLSPLPLSHGLWVRLPDAAGISWLQILVRSLPCFEGFLSEFSGFSSLNNNEFRSSCALWSHELEGGCYVLVFVNVLFVLVLIKGALVSFNLNTLSCAPRN